jgi:hypothetical protein
MASFGRYQDAALLSERYPSKEALDRAIDGMEDAMPETFARQDQLLVAVGASKR